MGLFEQQNAANNANHATPNSVGTTPAVANTVSSNQSTPVTNSTSSTNFASPTYNSNSQYTPGNQITAHSSSLPSSLISCIPKIGESSYSWCAGSSDEDEDETIVTVNSNSIRHNFLTKCMD